MINEQRDKKRLKVNMKWRARRIEHISVKNVVSNKKTIFFGIIFLGIFLSSAGYAKASMPDWHKITPCIGCHQETLDAPAGPGECGACHNYVITNNTGSTISVQLLQEQHNPIICKGCHIGNTMIDGSDKDIFHSGHGAVDCTRCHTTDNMTVIKLKNKNFECASCHGSQVHAIHVKNLGNICSICHGSWAKNKVYKPSGSNLGKNETMANKELEGYTLFGMLRRLFDAIFGIGTL